MARRVFCLDGLAASWSMLRVASCRATFQLCVLSWVLLDATPGHASQDASDRAAIARQLFDEGRALMEQARHTEACPKFEESHRLDPGGGTLLNLALCHERIGRTATSWAEYHEALRIARNDGRLDRQEFAQTHIEALTPVLSRLRVVVTPAARVPGLEIRRNGVPLGETSWNAPIFVDPGEQIVEANAPGKLPLRVSVVVGAPAEEKTVTIGALRDAPAQRTPAGGGRGVAAPVASSGSRQRALGIVVAGAGVATLAVGAFLGVRALGLDERSEEGCPARPAPCEPSAVDDGQAAVTYATWSTALLVGGAVVAGAGVTLWWTAPRSNGAVAGVSGRF